MTRVSELRGSACLSIVVTFVNVEWVAQMGSTKCQELPHSWSSVPQDSDWTTKAQFELCDNVLNIPNVEVQQTRPLLFRRAPFSTSMPLVNGHWLLDKIQGKFGCLWHRSDYNWGAARVEPEAVPNLPTI